MKKSKSKSKSKSAWTSLDERLPKIAETVLLTSCDKRDLASDYVGPRGNVYQTWTGFFSGSFWTHNRSRNDTTSAKFWAPLPL